jgi:hypothetical protein
LIRQWHILWALNDTLLRILFKSPIAHSIALFCLYSSLYGALWARLSK